MSEPAPAAPPAAGAPAPAPAPPPAPAPAAPAPEPGPGGTAAPAPAPAPGGTGAPAPAPAARTPWYETRIGQLTAANARDKAALDAANAELQRLRGAAPAPAPAPGAPAPAAPAPTAVTPGTPAFDQAVAARAQQIAAETAFTNACNDVYQRGKAADPNFDATVRAFDNLGGLGAHRGLLEAVTAVPNGEQVLRALGSDLNEASRILQLPAVQQAVEVANLAAKLRATPVSQAPKPATPVAGGGGGDGTVGPNDQGEFPGNTEAERQANYRKWREKNFKKK